MIPHFFVAPEGVAAGEALLGEDDTRHLVNVLRAQVGDPVTVADGSGTVWSGAYQGLSDGMAAVSLVEATTEPAQRPVLTVVHALPKRRKLDDVVQRLTELGVGRIVPVHSERSQVQLDDSRASKAVARWRSVALAAAKQSRRATLPVIDEVGRWGEDFPTGIPGVVCWEESTVGLRDAVGRVPADDEFVVGIGPEGGLTAHEVDSTGLPHGSLGRTVLRTETAAVVAVAAIRFHLGLMENR